MIPRYFHWIWLGDSPIPADQMEWIDGWRRRHRDWQSTIWTDDDRPRLLNERLFRRARNRVQQSDILRYEVLYRFGGVYLDTDVECVSSLEPIIADVSAFAAEERDGVLGSAVVGAEPGHKWLEHLLEAIPVYRFYRGGQSHETGPMMLTNLTIGRDDVRILPSACFYSVGWESKGQQPDSNAVGVHRWNGAWDYAAPRFFEKFNFRLRRLVPEFLVSQVIRVRQKLYRSLSESRV